MKLLFSGIAFCLIPFTLLTGESDSLELPEFSAPNANRDWKNFFFPRGKAFRNGPRKKPYGFGRFKHSRIKDNSVAWKWGARSGVGYNTDIDNWNVIASYSRFHTKLFANPAEMLGNTWRLHMDLADMEVGRGIEIAKSLLLRPHAGIRGAWLYQKKKAAAPKEIEMVSMQSKEPFLASDCVGFGVRSGLDSLWNVGRGVSLFGDGALSFLTGYQAVIPKGTDLSIIEEIQKERRGITTAELALGMQYVKPLLFQKRLTVRLGYDMNYILNQEEWTSWFTREKAQVGEGGVSLQGVSLGIRLDY